MTVIQNANSVDTQLLGPKIAPSKIDGNVCRNTINMSKAAKTKSCHVIIIISAKVNEVNIGED